jgi:DNA helicase-2/ATP-dependent DNA helicase PcrA
LGIYGRCQAALIAGGVLDFDDLVWRAADLLDQSPEPVQMLRRRRPFVLEDEAQDSVPLRSYLLETLAGPAGNWVRVGDPNQAIASTFTAARPRDFRAFLARTAAQLHALAESGRSGRRIIGMPNRLVYLSSRHHPLAEFEQQVFSPQHIAPTPPDDPQPNRPDQECRVHIHLLPAASTKSCAERRGWPTGWASGRPDQTSAIPFPTNEVGTSCLAGWRRSGYATTSICGAASASGASPTIWWRYWVCWPTHRMRVGW